MLGGGSPNRGNRRRRLIDTIVPKNKNNDPYSSIHSFSSVPSLVPTGFAPVDPDEEQHGYRINVARDGSMITAVPIDKQLMLYDGGRSRFKAPPRRAGPLRRESPIMYGEPQHSTSGTSWSTQSLLDARGKQRHKMKRARPVVTNDSTNNTPKGVVNKKSSFPPHDPFNNAVHTARDKLKQLKLIPQQHPTPQKQDASKYNNKYIRDRTMSTDKYHNHSSPSRSYTTRKTKVRWDLSPKRHRHQEPQSTLQLTKSSSSNLDDASSFSSFPILSSNHKFDVVEVEEKSSNGKGNGNNNNAVNTNNGNQKAEQSYDALLQHRMAEIQEQKKELEANITKKDAIKGTLITAINGNLERHRKELIAMDEEMKKIQWHLNLDSEKKKQQQKHIRNNTKVRNINRIDEEITEIRIARSPSGAYDMESLTEADPSITADTDSVAALYRNVKRDKRSRDPPARRPSPPTIVEEVHKGRETKEPDGPRISAVLRGNQNVIVDDMLKELEKDDGSEIKVAERPPLPFRQHQQAGKHQHAAWQQQQRSMPQSSQKVRGKFVQFNLPRHDTDSTELKFTNSIDTPSTGFVDGSNNDVIVGNKDDISWTEEHFDVDQYDEATGSFISSEHHDMYQWTDQNEHVVVAEHYSRENHHHHHRHLDLDEDDDDERSPPLAMNNDRDNYTEDRGAASDSVETDPDLEFMHVVAAVVLQTAVRRYLAEIAYHEKLYAVDVIQSTVCNWMASRREREHYDYNNPVEMYHDEEKYSPNPYNGEPTQRTKRVIFEDDYMEFRIFAATEIQRWWRGWWARDSLELDHFAATTIQRVFRGYWVREGLDVDRYCAVECQRIIRGYLARMACIYDLYCIIVTQSVARRYLAFYTSAVRLANILYIQAIYRGYRVRAELRHYVTAGQEVAATFIQSQWRSYDAQMNYINTLADILIVQSVARRWLVLRKLGRRRLEKKLQHARLGDDHKPPTNNINQDKGAPNSGATVTKKGNNTHAVWQQHRLNIVSNSKPLSPESKPLSPKASSQLSSHDGLDDGEWNDNKLFGNKMETSDMLKSWKGRKR